MQTVATKQRPRPRPCHLAPGTKPPLANAGCTQSSPRPGPSPGRSTPGGATTGAATLHRSPLPLPSSRLDPAFCGFGLTIRHSHVRSFLAGRELHARSEQDSKLAAQAVDNRPYLIGDDRNASRAGVHARPLSEPASKRGTTTGSVLIRLARRADRILSPSRPTPPIPNRGVQVASLATPEPAIKLT